jgi:hypothetical protein
MEPRGLALERRQPGVVGRDAAAFDREEHVGTLLLDGRHDLGQGLELVLDRQVELHLVEAHRPLGGQQLPALVDGLLGLGPPSSAWAAALRSGVEKPSRLRKAPQGVEEDGVLVGTARDGRGVGLVVADIGGQARERHGVELEIAVLGPALLGLGQGVLERLQPDVALQPAIGRGLQPHLGDHAQRSQRDLGGLEDVGVRGARVAVDDLALGRDQPQGRDVAVQGLLDRRARAVGAVARAPARACLLMSGRLAMARPLAARAGPSAPSRVPAATMASSPSQAMIPDIASSETSVPSVGARAVNEWPAPTGRIGAGRPSGPGEFGLGLGGQAGGGIGVLHARPVAPQQLALGVGESAAPAVRACLRWRLHSRRRPATTARPGARDQRSASRDHLHAFRPRDLSSSGVFAPRHEAYESVEIVRGASAHCPPAGMALKPWTAWSSSVASPCFQRGSQALRSWTSGAPVPGMAWQALQEVAVQRRQPRVGRRQRQGLLRRRRGRHGLGSRPPGPGPGRRPEKPRSRTIRRSRSGAWRR